MDTVTIWALSVTENTRHPRGHHVRGKNEVRRRKGVKQVKKQSTDLSKKERQLVPRIEIFVQSSSKQNTQLQTNHGSGGQIANGGLHGPLFETSSNLTREDISLVKSKLQHLADPGGAVPADEIAFCRQASCQRHVTIQCSFRIK